MIPSQNIPLLCNEKVRPYWFGQAFMICAKNKAFLQLAALDFHEVYHFNMRSCKNQLREAF